ncbi:MAG: hypothetical protein ACK4YT_14080, partial [Sphingomonas sp.]
IVVDIQGAGAPLRATSRALMRCDTGVGDLYTDPQVHTISGTEFSAGNLGVSPRRRRRRRRRLCRRAG